MYARDISVPRPSPLENGIPVIGTWNRPFAEVELLDVVRPYALPLPKSLRDYRIKEWQAFQIQDERYYVTAALINVKYYRIAQVTLWDKETKEKLEFRKGAPPWRLAFPPKPLEFLRDQPQLRFLFSRAQLAGRGSRGIGLGRGGDQKTSLVHRAHRVRYAPHGLGAACQLSSVFRPALRVFL